MKRTIYFLLFSALASTAFAGDFTICSTGLATATTSGCGPAINSPLANNLLPDGNWYVSSNSSGTFQSQAFVTINNSFPVQNAGPWLGNDASSAWITPSNDQNGQYINGTSNYFSTQFNLTGPPSLAQISGFWLADDYGSGIFLNGVSVGQASLPAFGGLGGPMVPFNITQGNPGMGQAFFTPGQNTLTFGVVNDATNHGQLNNPATSPTGVRVLFTSATDSVPEPGTMLLMGGGLIGIGLLARRYRTAQA